MQTVTLGRKGPTVGAVGLGCMGMSGIYGPADEAESIATIHAALEAGITLLDTGDFYGMGHNEMLIRRGARRRPRDARRAVGEVRRAARSRRRLRSASTAGRPAVKNFLAYTLRRLGTDYIDIYRPARARSGGADRGYRRRHRRHGQGRLRPPHRPVGSRRRDHPPRARRASDRRSADRIFADRAAASRTRSCRLTRELGIGITAYGVLSRGLLERRIFRRRTPRATSASSACRALRAAILNTICALVEALRRIGNEKSASPSQLAIAWVRSRGADIVPVIGARRREQLKEALGALELSLDAADIARIDAAVSPSLTAGARYDPAQMAHLDSEARNSQPR